MVLYFLRYQHIIHYHLYSLLALARVQVLGVEFGKEIVMEEADWVNYRDSSMQLEFVESLCIFLAAGIEKVLINLWWPCLRIIINSSFVFSFTFNAIEPFVAMLLIH